MSGLSFFVESKSFPLRRLFSAEMYSTEQGPEGRIIYQRSLNIAPSVNAGGPIGVYMYPKGHDLDHANGKREIPK